MKPDFQSWQSVWDRIPANVLFIRPDYRIFWANDQARREYENTGILYEGRTCYELIHQLSQTCHDCPIRTAQIRRKWISAFHDHPTPDGQFMACRIESFPVLSESGEIEFLVHIQRDITEEKRMQDQLIQTEKMAGIGILASGVAHEINNPLTGILGLAEILQETVNPALRDQYLKEIITNCLRISNIVKDLSAYFRIPQSETVSAIDLNQTLRDALGMVRMDTQFENLEVIEALMELESIQASPLEIQQLFVNLIRNAVEAMQGKGVLRLTSRKTVRGLEVEIRDTGPGITTTDRKKIFDPFFTNKSPGRGTGLGLHVAYHLITKYHGSIEVESQAGRGATFRVIFPVRGEKNEP